MKQGLLLEEIFYLQCWNLRTIFGRCLFRESRDISRLLGYLLCYY